MIKIKSKAYNTLAKEMQKFTKADSAHKKRTRGCYLRPYLYVVGVNPKSPDIICQAYKLKANTDNTDRCHQMSNLASKEFIKGAMKIMKDGNMVIGLVRIGDFIRNGYNHHDVGAVRSQLYCMNKDMLFISIQKHSIVVERNRKSMELKVIK